ncbi:uncharacterized protein LOC135384367 [Ornithodoros turicata]|uniref:uncharacterized protein LOC135384367 n=1 Tax=Ornithodoros turicata TaxID=34597 RepID=UPI003138872F
MYTILDDKRYSIEVLEGSDGNIRKKVDNGARELQEEGFDIRCAILEPVLVGWCDAGDIGLPKIHKEGCPLRPIVSFVDAPSYNLSRFLADMLTAVKYRNGLSVNNSFEFSKFVCNLKLSDNTIRVSFDVVSLFTNMPNELALTIARKKLEEDGTLEERTAFSADNNISLLKMCLEQSFFLSKGSKGLKVSKQIDGCPMGSPISMAVTNLTFSDIHQNIRFTPEEESCGQIPFLDVLVKRHASGVVSTSVCMKPCEAGQVLHFDSAHSPEDKRAVVRSLAPRSLNPNLKTQLETEGDGYYQEASDGQIVSAELY